VPNVDLRDGSLDADGSYVVWADSNFQVHQVKTSGGAVTTFAQTVLQWAGTGPVLRNGTVAFLDGARNVDTAPEGQSVATSKAMFASTYQGQCVALNPSATSVFFIGQMMLSPSNTDLVQCPLAAGTCAMVGSSPIETLAMSGGGGRGKLLVNTNYAFWAYGASAPTSINRYTFATNAITSVNSEVDLGPAIDATNVYWAGTPFYTIYSLPQTFLSTDVPKNVANSAAAIIGLASDGTNVYFGTAPNNAAGSVYYVPVGGGTPTLMYTSPQQPSNENSMVAAAGGVYWADRWNGACPPTYNIMGVAAP
jgi:hypothetical protein